jgi:hypothetical protein
MAKDPKRFPEFNDATASDLRTSLELFVEDVVWSESSDFRELLQADWLYLNGRLAQLYRPDLPPDAPFIKMETLPGERAGVLTHPYMMAGFAYTATSSPIHRGVFIARSVLGRSLRPPPEAVSPLPVELHANLTTRERISLQTKGEACQTCHNMINPLGFTLENFDAVRFRGEERASRSTAGGYRTRKASGQIRGVRDLASFWPIAKRPTRRSSSSFSVPGQAADPGVWGWRCRFATPLSPTGLVSASWQPIYFRPRRAWKRKSRQASRAQTI